MGTVGPAAHEIGRVVVGGIDIVGITLWVAEGYSTDVSSTRLWRESVGSREGSTSGSFSVTAVSSRGKDYLGESGFRMEVSDENHSHRR